MNDGRSSRAWGDRSRFAVVALLLVIAFSAAYRMYLVNVLSITNDDMFTRAAARLPFDMSWALVRYDLTHPPGYYLLQRLAYLVLPDNRAGLVAIPLLASVATVVLVAQVVWRRGTPWLAVAACMLLALSVLHARYATIGRSYALISLLVVLYASLLISSQRPRVVLEWLCLAALFIVHYFGPVYAGALLVGYLITNRQWDVRRMALFAAACIPLALWCLIEIPVALTKRRSPQGMLQNLGWIAKPSVGEVAWVFGELVNAPGIRLAITTTALLVASCVIVFFRTRAYEHPAGRAAIIPFVGGVLPPAVIGLAAMLIPGFTVFVNRQFLASQPLLIIAFALGAAAVFHGNSRWARAPFTLAFLWMFVGAISQLGTQRSKQYDVIASDIRRVRTGGEPLLATWVYDAGTPVSFYLDRSCLPRVVSNAAMLRGAPVLGDYSACPIGELNYDSLPPKFLLVREYHTPSGLGASERLAKAGYQMDTIGIYNRGEFDLTRATRR